MSAHPSQAQPEVPSYRFHKARRCAVVTIAGKNYYLGPYYSPGSLEKYRRLIYEWLASGAFDSSSSSASPTTPPALTVNKLILRYWPHVESYSRKGGKPTSEASNARTALRHLHALHEHLPVADFTPLCLAAVRSAILFLGTLARGTVNRYTDRIRAMFKWGVSQTLVPVAVYQALMALDQLKKDLSPARESRKVLPVPWSIVEATLPHLSPTLHSLVRVQFLLAACPVEVCALRPRALDTSESPWGLTPSSHKTEHYDRPRVLFIAP